MKERASPMRAMAPAIRLQKRMMESENLRRAARAAGYFAAGLLCSRGVIFGRHAPFGIAVAAGCPRSAMWITALGSAVGYLLPGGSPLTARYLAALLLFTVLRFLLGEIPRFRNSVLFCAVITAVPVFLTGALAAIMDGSTVQTWALYLAESVLGGATVIFFRRTGLLLTAGRWGRSRQGR